MTDLHIETPLQWPSGRPVTPAAEKSQPPGFKPTLLFKEALDYVREEVRELDCEGAILHTNFENVENDHMRRKLEASNGASITLRIAGRAYMLACDSWMLGQHNIYALHLAIRHLRLLTKWGIGSLPVAFQGFMASEEDTTDTVVSQLSGQEPWLIELGLGPTARLYDANATYRARAKEAANDPNTLMRLNSAIEKARRALS